MTAKSSRTGEEIPEGKAVPNEPVATGQSSPYNVEYLPFQPGYWLPHEQADPLSHPQATYVDYTDDPIGHADWRIARDANNKLENGQPE